MTKNSLPRKSEKSVKLGTIATRNTPQPNPSNPEIRGAILGRDYSGKHPPKGFGLWVCFQRQPNSRFNKVPLVAFGSKPKGEEYKPGRGS